METDKNSNLYKMAESACQNFFDGWDAMFSGSQKAFIETWIEGLKTGAALATAGRFGKNAGANFRRQLDKSLMKQFKDK